MVVKLSSEVIEYEVESRLLAAVGCHTAALAGLVVAMVAARVATTAKEVLSAVLKFMLQIYWRERTMPVNDWLNISKPKPFNRDIGQT